MLNLEFGSLVLVQFCLQQLLSHLNLAFEAILMLVALVGFERVLAGSLFIRPRGAGLPLSSKHNSVPKFQPLEQTAVSKLQRQTHTRKTWAKALSIRMLSHKSVTHVIAEKFCVVSWGKSVHPETRGSAVCVPGVNVLVIFSAFRLNEHVVHTTMRTNMQQLFTFV